MGRRHTNSWDFVQNRSSIHSNSNGDSSIPEPIEFNKAYNGSNNMFNALDNIELLLSSKCEHQNQYAKQYMLQKVEQRLKEIEHISNSCMYSRL